MFLNQEKKKKKCSQEERKQTTSLSINRYYFFVTESIRLGGWVVKWLKILLLNSRFSKENIYREMYKSGWSTCRKHHFIRRKSKTPKLFRKDSPFTMVFPLQWEKKPPLYFPLSYFILFYFFQPRDKSKFPE